MANWNVNVGLSLSISYDDIEADSKEEAEEIAKDRALEDIEFNNCDCDPTPFVYCAYTDEEMEEGYE